LPRWTQYLQPAAAGLLIGVIGIWLPQVMGAGYGFIDQAMHDQFTWQILALLAMVKILSTSLSFVSGTPGGMFAPTLFIGAMLGGAVGAVEHHFFPWLSGGVGAYALVGMGTLFAGFLRVPLTSVFMVLEVSGNYSIILPVMISNTIAYLISRQYQETSLFDLLSRQDGMDLPSMEERREEIMVHVEDAMRKYQGTLLNIEDPLRWSLAQAEKSQEEFVIVEDGVGKWFGIKKEELRRQASAAREGASLRTVILDEPLPHVHPDHTLEEALRRLGDLPILPVVNRANFHKLEGVVGLPDILRAYHSAG
jgi:CIC family chloride channel protein